MRTLEGKSDNGVMLTISAFTKDAYDIVYVLDHYGNGVKEVANAFVPFLRESQIQDSLKRIDKMFSNERSKGPLLYAEFMESLNEEEREIFAHRG
ncbi:MAG: hypothetical protein M1166_06975 [Candidatus Thermoplasmatota archaeon]|nr:hypothetical protein [Candidatus Thermoplasmatota archaeon]